MKLRVMTFLIAMGASICADAASDPVEQPRQSILQEQQKGNWFSGKYEV